MKSLNLPKIEKLFRALLSFSDKEQFRSIPISEAFLTEDEKKDGYLRKISLSAREYQKYQEIFEHFRAIQELEYLSNEELQNKINNLVCEILLKKDVYNNKAILHSKLIDFFESLTRDILDYEVYFGIKNMELICPKIEFGELLIFIPDSDFLNNISKSLNLPPDTLENEFKVFGRIKERGNNISLVKHRAKNKLFEYLSIVKISYQKKSFIHEKHIDFSLSEFSFHRSISEATGISWAWSRNKTPPIISYGSDEHITNLTGLLSGINSLEESFVNKIKMSLHWINLAYCEICFEIKHIYLCTALECLLTTISDRRKGELLAYRMFLLNTNFEDTFFLSPDDILLFYERRSELLHGAKLDISASEKYTVFLIETQKTLSNIILLANKHSIRDQNEIIRCIENLHSKDKAINYMKRFNSKRHSQILKEIEN